MTRTIRIAETDGEIMACFPVMRELRPKLADAEFVQRVRSQQESGGYRIASVTDGDEVLAIAGFRILENLAWGKFLYVDDLVTAAHVRSLGIGSDLLLWLENFAIEQGCSTLQLDSGVQRTDAHRFYDKAGYARTSFHFAKPLD